jgi:hypothetical protein
MKNLTEKPGILKGGYIRTISAKFYLIWLQINHIVFAQTISKWDWARRLYSH